MRMWIFVTYPGVIAISDGFKEYLFKPFGDEKPDADKAAKALLDLEKNKMIDELREIVQKIKDSTIKVDSESFARLLRSEFPDLDIEIIDGGKELLKAREHVSRIYVEIFGSYEKYVEFASRVSAEISKAKVAEAGERRDLMIIRAVTISEDLTKMINTLVSHVREWYGYYWPELGKEIEDHELYLTLVSELGRVENFTEENLRKYIKNEKLIKAVLKAKSDRVGISITDRDIEMIQHIARRTLDLYKDKERILEYLDELMQEAAPNIRALIGSVIGAKLIRKAGGIGELAKMPSSTIQILGAEKALFRALHGKGTPPKHGIIFQDPRIFKAPWWQRGKIARALAGKLTIAARVDYFTGEYIGDELLRDLERRIEEIKKKYPKPPIKKREEKKPRPPPKGKKPHKKRKKKGKKR